MYFYFCAQYPSVIKLNGIYYGQISNTIKSCNFDGIDSPFIEVCPLLSNGATLNFILDQNFLSSPPENVSVTDMKGGYLIKFSNPPLDKKFNVIGQHKEPNLLCTVFNDLKSKLSIETPTDFYAEDLPFEILSVQFSKGTGNAKNLLAVAYNLDPIRLEVFSVNEKIVKVYSNQVESYLLDQTLSTTERFNDIAKHVRSSVWELKNGVLQQKSINISLKDSFSLQDLPPKLVPFAFLEELLVGGDLAEYLSENILKNKDMLGEYFGDFIGIMPPPIFRRIEEVGLIYHDTNTKYFIEYFSFEIENGKILNIKKSD